MLTQIRYEVIIFVGLRMLTSRPNFKPFHLVSTDGCGFYRDNFHS